MAKSLIVGIIVGIIHLGIVHLEPVWQRNHGGAWTALFILALLVTFVWLCIKVLIELFRLYWNRKSLTVKSFFPIIVISAALVSSLFNPLGINLEKTYGETLFRACYEGTQNQATFKLKTENKLEVHWTGAFFYNQYFTGTYSQSGDTLYLNWETETPRLLSDTLVIHEENLFRLQADTLAPTYFYLGYCKGLN